MSRPEAFSQIIRAVENTAPMTSQDEQRLVELPNGMTVFVTVTMEQRRRLIHSLPKGWGEAVMMRESGKSVKDIAYHFHRDEGWMQEHLSTAYGVLEQAIARFCDAKAGVKR